MIGHCCWEILSEQQSSNRMLQLTCNELCPKDLTAINNKAKP